MLPLVFARLWCLEVEILTAPLNMSIVLLTQSERRWNVVGSGIRNLKFGRCPQRTAVPALPPLTVEEWFV